MWPPPGSASVTRILPRSTRKGGAASATILAGKALPYIIPTTFTTEQAMRGITLVAALMGLGMTASAHAATAFGPQAVPPAAHMFTVGKLKLAALHDADMVVANDGKIFGVGVDPA